MLFWICDDGCFICKFVYECFLIEFVCYDKDEVVCYCLKFVCDGLYGVCWDFVVECFYVVDVDGFDISIRWFVVRFE